MNFNKIRRRLENGRVVLIEKKKKNPFEPAWTLNEGLYERVEGGAWKNKKTGEFYRVKGEIYTREPTNYRFNDPRVQQHLANGGNIGFLCGSGKIYVFDLDKIELLREFEEILRETLTIETAKGYHLYVESDEELYKIIFEKNGVHLGELLGIGQQCLIPPSIHPSGKEYKIFKELPIIKLTKEKLELIKEKFTDKPRTFTIQSPDWSQYKNLSGLDMSSLIPLLPQLKKYGNELYGSHPVHGSTTGMNFFINPSKGLFHCFRHDSGGDALALTSILEGIRNCEDFRKDGIKLRGDDFKKVIKIAEEKYGFSFQKKTQNSQINNESVLSQLNIRVISVRELMDMDIPLPKWIIKNLVPEGSIVLLAGKSASMKSFLSTLMAVCCMHDKDFLGKFETQKGIWIYFDEDNPLRLTKDRTLKVLRGLSVDVPENFKYISQSGLKLDIEDHVELLEQIIREYRPSVVILDSLIKFLATTNENDSGEMDNIFNKLRRLAEIYNTTFLIIHHLRKSSSDKRPSDSDEMIRGSTAIVNSCDVINIISRKSKSHPYLNIKQVKNRYDQEIDPFVVLVSQTPDKSGLSFELSANVSEEQDIVSKAADEIYEWLIREKEWSDTSNMIFKTKEVREHFARHFNEKDERNRKIIHSAIFSLIADDRIEQCPTKGYYKVIKLLTDVHEQEESDDNTEDETLDDMSEQL
jgi:hypothetical protein